MSVSVQEIPLRERQKQSREQDILESALQLIRQDGFESVTMSDVAKAAGVARATVFNYFPTKDRFLAEYHRRMTSKILGSFDPASGPSGIANLERLVHQLCSWANQEPNLARAIVRRIFVSTELTAQDQDDENDLHLWLTRAFLHSQRIAEIAADFDVQNGARIVIAILSAAGLDWVASGANSSLWRMARPPLLMFLNLSRIQSR